MKNLKKLISIILAVIMLSSVCVVSGAQSGSDSDNQALLNKYEMIKALGLYNDSMKMDEFDRVLTREEYAMVLAGFYGTGEGEIAISPYSDVAVEDESAKSIVTLTDMGILSGQPGGVFYPKNPITSIQAIKGMVILAGYKEHAINRGGYPAGYISIALDLGITKSVAQDHNLTCGEFTEILYELLHTQMLVETGYTGNQFSFEIPGITVLNHYFDVYVQKGIFKVNGGSALIGEDEEDAGIIKVGGKLFFAEKSFTTNLGMLVNLYYKDTGRELGEAIYMDSTRYNNEVVEVMADDIADTTTATKFRFYKDGEKLREATLSSEASIIINGRLNVLYSKEDLMPKNGKVTLIDADSDNIIETVIVESYLTYWVSQISADNEKITIGDKLGKTPIEINVDDDELSVVYENASADISAVSKGAVLFVAADKMESTGVDNTSECYKLIISNKTVSGAISAIDEKTVVIANSEYKLNADFNENEFPLKLGVNCIFYLDAQNNIVAYTSESSADYAYLIEAGTVSGFDTRLLFKMYTAQGETKTYDAAKKIKVDGYSYDDMQTLLDALQAGSVEYHNKTKYNAVNSGGRDQLVQYRLNAKGEISSIDTLMPNKGYITADQEGLHFDMLLEGSADSVLYFFAQGKTISGRVFFSDNLPFFNIPENLEEEKNYRIGSMGDYSGEQITSHLAVFDSDEFFRAKVIVTPAGGGGGIAVMERENMMLVTDFVNVKNSSEDFVKSVKGVRISDGSIVTVVPKESGIVESADIEKGDIMRWKENLDGEAIIFERSVSPYDDDGTFLGSNSNWKHDYAWYSNWRLAIGRAVSTDGEFIKLHYEASKISPPDNIEVNSLDKVERVIVYDRKTGEARIGTVMDIETDKELGAGKGNKIFTYQFYNAINWMVIFK